MFIKIEDFEEEKIWSGTILRIFLKNQTEFYYSDRVFDIILFENYTDEMGLGALQISGYKSGKISLFFPKEAYFDESLYSIKTDWVREQLLSSLNINAVDGELFICRETNIVPF